METASPKLTVACVHSATVTNSQNLLPISAETSLSTQST